MAEFAGGLWQHLLETPTLPCDCDDCATLRQETARAERRAALAPTMRALLCDVADYFTSDRQRDPHEAMALHGRIVVLLRETATADELERLEGTDGHRGPDS